MFRTILSMRMPPPGKQVTVSTIEGPSVKLQWLDSRGFDRLWSLDRSRGVQLGLGSALVFPTKGPHGDGFAFAVAETVATSESVIVLGMVDIDRADMGLVEEALTSIESNSLYQAAVRVFHSVLLRSGSHVGWHSWTTGEGLHGRPHAALLFSPARIGIPRPAYEAVVAGVREHLMRGWQVWLVEASHTIAKKLDSEYALGGALVDLAHTFTRGQSVRNFASVGPWMVCPEVDFEGVDSVVVHLSKGPACQQAPMKVRIFIAEVNHSLTGRGDLQEAYDRLRREGASPEVVADILLYT